MTTLHSLPWEKKYDLGHVNTDEDKFEILCKSLFDPE